MKKYGSFGIISRDWFNNAKKQNKIADLILTLWRKLDSQLILDILDPLELKNALCNPK